MNARSWTMAIASLGVGPASVFSSARRATVRTRSGRSGPHFDRRAPNAQSQWTSQGRGCARRRIETVVASTEVYGGRVEVASVTSDFPPGLPERPSTLDSPSKVAFGSLALFVLLGAVHPDPALAREVTLDLPDFDIPDFGVPDIPTSPMEFLEVVTTNPYAAVAASVAAYLVIPKAAELLVKYVLVPALLLLVAYEASQNPDETIALVASAINQARDHPTVTSGIILAILCLVLSPYILVAAGVGALVSGVQLLPDQIKPVLPGPVREIEAQIETLQRAVDPGVKRARELGSRAVATGEKLRREADSRRQRADAERETRLREQAESAAAVIEETKAVLVAPVVTVQKAAETAAKETRENLADVTEAVAEAGAGAGQTVRCTSYETSKERSDCVDRQRDERKRREIRRTEELREKANRLRANSAERERPVPDLLGGSESSE